ncbi:protein kinase family protein [Parafrankia discariae]|uniref:DNA-binding protein n=1 Tax=Parafrankia discariae TaxID=365528 RepID=UPI00039B27CE|nr:DNA-binding protein [Parafrankia discariae]
MKLPTLLDYQQAVQVPRLAFLDDRLRASVPRLTPLGMPAVATGGFALTFDVSLDGRRHAVRCFHRHSDNLELRYACIAEFVRSAALDFLVGVDYQPAGIRVRGHCWPIVRMEWIDGARLDDWVQENLDRPARLDRVRLGLGYAVAELRRRGAAHGDLQHGNILVLPDTSVRLVDYDGMYLPGLGGLGASERGHRNYQHPDRSNQYDVTLDRFAEEVITVSLAALARNPGLWREFNTGENLIFSAADFADPSASALFARLERMPGVAATARRLRDACLVDFQDVPAVLDADALAPYRSGPAGAGPVPVGGPRALARQPRPAGVAVPAAPAGVAGVVGVVSTVSAARYLRTRPLRPAPLPVGGPGVLSALDRAGLLARRGEETTVVGRVVRVRQLERTGLITVLEFGDDRGGGFSVVGWDRVSRELIATHGDPARLEGTWVRVIGQLAVDDRGSLSPAPTTTSPARAVRPTGPSWSSRPNASNAGRPPAPRIELRRGSLLRVLTERQAASLLNRPGTVPAAPATRSAYGSGPVLPTRRPLPAPSVPGPTLTRAPSWRGWS